MNDVAARVSTIVGARVVDVADVPEAGGYSHARRLIASLDDGSTVFVKVAVDDRSARWLELERRAYDALAGSPFMPRHLGDDERVLVLEDLRRGHWPPPWRSKDLGRVIASLDDLWSTPPPLWAEPMSTRRGELRQWQRLAGDRAALIESGACTAAWLDAALPTLVEAEASAEIDGDRLVHFDLRGDNICLVDERVLVIDWGVIARGNADLDLAFFAATVELDGGPPAEDVAPVDPRLSAIVAGFFAEGVRTPAAVNVDRIAAFRRAMLHVALAWAARVLDLPPPAP